VSRLSARDLCVAPPAEGAQGRGAPEPVVRGFSLELGAGEWVAITGPNGCGKTCLLLALSGLWPVASGSVRFEGEPLGPGKPGERRARLAVVLQDPSSQLLQPSVREELAFAALNLGQPEADVAAAVTRWSARLGLDGDLDRDPRQLSAGRQQLVLLGAALVPQPTLLLADEPAAHLDAAARSRVLAAVREEVARGLTVAWVTQNHEESRAADRVIRMADGDPADSESAWGAVAPPAPTLLTLRVAPWLGAGGPAVRTAVPLEIVVGKTGVTSIEGPNASGKSVLLSIAAGILRLDQVELDGGAGLAPPAILSSQYPELEIFEERVGDEVAYAAASRGLERTDAAARAARMLGRLGLEAEGFAARHTWTLSTGEKRLVSLASALIAPAALVILDEPTAGLDACRRRALAGVLGEIARGAAVLVASQDGAWLASLGARRHRVGAPEPSPAASPSEKTD